MATTEKSPEWLKRTQEGSWEPEILISGIILLALTQVPRLLDKLHFYLEEQTSGFWFYTSFSDDFVITLLKTSSYWLIAALIAHLMLRSVWVSFVGLSYVYPNGINHERLKLNSYFSKKIAAIPNFQDSLQKLERVCSSIYATAFLLVMATISACLYGIFIILLAWVFGAVARDFFSVGGRMDDTLGFITLILALPYFIDFLTLGALKRIKFILPIYRPIYWFMSTITLAPIYRGIYYGLLSQLNRKYLIAGVLIFVSITFASVFRVNKSGKIGQSELLEKALGLSVVDGYYRDQIPERYSTWAHIQSATISDGVLELFLVHKVQFEKLILESCEDNRKYAGDMAVIDDAQKKNLACLAAFFTINIDGNAVKPEKYFFREMSSTSQSGLFTWIDVSQLPKGLHTLEIFVNYTGENHVIAASIPFYKSSESAGGVQLDIEKNPAKADSSMHAADKEVQSTRDQSSTQ
jgi:hypothetical protein